MSIRRLKKLLGVCAIALIPTLGHAAEDQPKTVWLDLTHAIPTFKPQAGKPLRSDYKAPWLGNKPHITWYQQGILTISHFATSTANYPSGKLIIDEHYGTHLDANNHT